MSVIEPDEIDDKDDLIDYVQDLEGRMRSLIETRGALFDRIENLEQTVDAQAERIEELDNEVGVVDASVPEQSKGKVENVIAVMKYAKEDANGGMGGVKIDTGEVTAAISGSRATARRLMDEIGGTFQWAETKNPGGPNPKELRLGIKDKSLSQLKSEVTDGF